MILRMLPEAEAEQAHAARSLERARTGHGLLFYDAYDTVMERAMQSPRMYAVAEDAPTGFEVREIYLAQFKYRIFYVLQDVELVVVAVAYAGRRPGYWHSRLP